MILLLNKVLENEEEDSDQLRNELNACQHFLTYTEMKNGRHKVFNFQLSKLDHNLVNEKLDQFFENLDCAAKINIALGFVLRNIETGEYLYFFIHTSFPTLSTKKKLNLQLSRKQTTLFSSNLEMFSFWTF